MPRHTRVLALAITTVVSACDIPTGIPKWDTTFVVKAENSVLAVDQLLPSSMGVAGGRVAFSIALSPAAFGETLRTLCAPCGTAHGQTVGKPAFTESMQTAIDLPVDVTGGTVAGGSILVRVRNGLSFDPVRPGADARGALIIRVRSGASLLGTMSVSGVVAALPPGAEMPITVPLTGGVVSGPIDVTITLESPAGDPARIDAAETITATATPVDIKLTTARIKVVNRQITAAPVTLRLSGIDSFIIQRVKGGTLPLTIDNPFGCSGTLTMRIAGGTRVITKTVAITAGASTAEVPLDEAELRAILGSDVKVTLTGPVSAPADVAVTPSQALTVAAQLKLVLGPDN